MDFETAKNSKNRPLFTYFWPNFRGFLITYNFVYGTVNWAVLEDFSAVFTFQWRKSSL